MQIRHWGNWEQLIFPVLGVCQVRISDYIQFYPLLCAAVWKKWRISVFGNDRQSTGVLCIWFFEMIKKRMSSRFCSDISTTNITKNINTFLNKNSFKY